MEPTQPQNLPLTVPHEPSFEEHRPKHQWILTILMLLIGLILGAGVVGLLWFYTPKPIPTTSQNSSNSTQHTSNSSGGASSSGSSSGVGSGGSNNTPSACTTSDLALSVGRVDGTAGTLYQHMVFTNTGTQSCTIEGYPAVFMLDTHNAVLGSGAVPMTTYTPTAVTLVPGATAHTAVGFPEPANFAAGTCTAHGTSIRIYLPGSTSYLDASLAQPYCPGFSATAVVSGE